LQPLAGALAAELVPGIEVRGVGTLLRAALLLGIVNAVIRQALTSAHAACHGDYTRAVSAGHQCGHAQHGRIDVQEFHNPNLSKPGPH